MCRTGGVMPTGTSLLLLDEGVSTKKCCFSLVILCVRPQGLVMMADRDVGGGCSARRRSRRRLRSWWRHEQRSVAAALTTMTHDSSQVGTQNDALRPEDSQWCWWVASNASGGGVRTAVGSSHGRSRGCPSVAGKCPSSPRW